MLYYKRLWLTQHVNGVARTIYNVRHVWTAMNIHIDKNYGRLRDVHTGCVRLDHMEKLFQTEPIGRVSLKECHTIVAKRNCILIPPHTLIPCYQLPSSQAQACAHVCVRDKLCILQVSRRLQFFSRLKLCLRSRTDSSYTYPASYLS